MYSCSNFLNALLLSTIATPLFGGMSAPMSLLDLEQRADIIVVGSVTDLAPAGPVASLRIRVDRVIKGDIALSGGTMPLSWPGAQNSASLRSGATEFGPGLWFLRRMPSSWELLPVFTGSAPLELSFFP